MNKYKNFESLMTYEKNNCTKERIVNAAIYTMATVGYVRATTKGIAELADVSEALIFKHYGNKQKLLGTVSMEIMEHRLPEIFSYKLDRLFQGDAAFDLDLFIEVLKERFANISQNAGYFKIIFLELENNSEDVIQALQHMMNKFFFQVENYVVQLQKMQVLKDDLPPRTIYRSFAGMFNFLLIDKKMLNKDLKIDEEIDVMLAMFMKGAAKDV